MLHAIVAAYVFALTRAGRFGPNDCVSVTRSPKGTCVLSTDCEGEDLAQVSFAFNCERDTINGLAEEQTEITWLDYGVGGFHAREEFDTEEQCMRCVVPNATPRRNSEEGEEDGDQEEEQAVEAPEAASVKSQDGEQEEYQNEEQVVEAPEAASVNSQEEDQQEKYEAEEQAVEVPEAASVNSQEGEHEKDQKEEQAEEAPSAAAVHFRAKSKAIRGQAATSKAGAFASEVTFGPGGCVKTWKDSIGHCIMQTSCTEQAMSGYNYGLICVDKTGHPTRHLFGENSFEDEETFDTMIKCDQCLGLEDIPKVVALAGRVDAIHSGMAEMKADLKLIKNKVGITSAAASVPAAPALFLRAPPGRASSPLFLESKHNKNDKAQHAHHHVHNRAVRHHGKGRGSHRHKAHHVIQAPEEA